MTKKNTVEISPAVFVECNMEFSRATWFLLWFLLWDMRIMMDYELDSTISSPVAL